MGFYLEVLKLCKKIPEGRVTTYKIIAEKLGCKAYRAVGTALRKNDKPVVIPCHRVIKSDGSVGDYSGEGGIKTKIRLLREEGVNVKDGKVDKQYWFYFK
ncbi:MGMT family protein [Candidatus Woesearchaeota archaeon]|nr:MGMT family protein [Candidatus Woesearchaeota archaeon]MBW3021960.1 MGMT family protein [Candidatus Woesearchaeota archaeon]